MPNPPRRPSAVRTNSTLTAGLIHCIILASSVTHSPATTPSSPVGPSIRAVHEKALRKEPLRVVFLGGSLTWGANASDPQMTSYRGLMMQWLRDRYPGTPWSFYDAAIGGTGSQLAIFRLERDVLSRNPDLVFLDFSVNDEAEGTDVQRLATYEKILRELISRNIMVLPVLTLFRWHAEKPDAPPPPRHQDHLRLAGAYRLPAADALREVCEAVRSGTDIKTLWPFDGAHPDDPGYRLIFEAVRDRYEKSVEEGTQAALPGAPVFGELYPAISRARLVDGSIPRGWTREKTYRTALWFDGLSSRWIGDVACAAARNKPEALEFQFSGSMVALLGEHNGLTPPVKVWIDGQPVAAPKAKPGDLLWPMSTARLAPPKKGSGNLLLWRILADDLPDGEHTLRIEPVWEGAEADAELRIESICSAGRRPPE